MAWDLPGRALHGGKEDLHDFIRSFGGSNRYILDLLGEEVLAGLPVAEREFMLKTSVLAEMAGPLCDEVVGGGVPERFCTSWPAPTCSSLRSTRMVGGIVTITCSPTCCSTS